MFLEVILVRYSRTVRSNGHYDVLYCIDLIGTKKCNTVHKTAIRFGL